MLEGKIDQDHRYDSITGEYVTERVMYPGEAHTAILLSGLNGRVGFHLKEVPYLDALDPTIARRKNSEVSFDTLDEANGAPDTNQFYINYAQEDSIVYLHDSQVGNVFVVQYTCKGSGQHAQNIKSLMRSVIEFNTGLSGKFKFANKYDKIINAANVYLLGKVAKVRNCLVQGNSVCRGNVAETVSFLEIYGDMTLERGSELQMSGVILIVHGSLKVSGTGANPKLIGFDGVAGTAGTDGIAGTQWGYGINIIGEFGQGPRDGGNGGSGGVGGKMLESLPTIGIGGVGGSGGGGGGCGTYYMDTFDFGYSYGGLPNGGTGEHGYNYWGAGGIGGVGLIGDAGSAGDLLFGHGGTGLIGTAGTDGGSGSITSIGGNGGNGGNGGYSGGSGIFIVCFGDIDPTIDIVTGKGVSGTQSGPLTLLSNYDSIPNSIDVAAGLDGVDGDINYFNIQERSDVHENFLTEFGYFTKGSINI